MRNALVLSAIGLALLIETGCARPVVPLDASTPPLVLVPASYAGVVDGRGRFREIYTAVREDHGHALPNDRPVHEALHRLSGEPDATGRPVSVGAARVPLRVAIVSGLFGECVPEPLSPFPHAREHLESHGYRTDLFVVGGRSSSEYNARQIRDALLASDRPADERLVLVGYSKGAVDVLIAVTEHPEVRERVAAVIAVAGPIGGSPIADDLDGIFLDLLERLDAPGCPVRDGGAIESLRCSVRHAWLAEHELPTSVRFYSLAGFADRERISTAVRSSYDDLATIDPRNDSQVIFSDAIIPRSTLLGFANVDHWGIAMAVDRDAPILAGTIVDRTAYPREVLLESAIRLVEEDLLEDLLEDPGAAALRAAPIKPGPSESAAANPG